MKIRNWIESLCRTKRAKRAAEDPAAAAVVVLLLLGAVVLAAVVMDNPERKLSAGLEAY